MIPNNLTNRTAIVTGAAQGIGKAIASRLANAGARVAIADLNLDMARETARQIRADALALLLDVANAESVQNAVDACLNAWGRIDILINNAGIIGRGVPVKDLTERDWDQVLDINLKGTFLCSRAVLPPMLAQKKRRHRLGRLHSWQRRQPEHAALCGLESGRNLLYQVPGQRAYPRQHPRQLRLARPNRNPPCWQMSRRSNATT